jgi:hypothetical protein
MVKALKQLVCPQSAIHGWSGLVLSPMVHALLEPNLQYPSPLCRLEWAVTHVIGLHVELTILRECDVALTNILGMLISNIVLMVDTRAH